MSPATAGVLQLLTLIAAPALAVSVLFLCLLQRLQGILPGSLGFVSIDPDQAINTAASFVANAN